ncbi:MAG: serine hydrolase [Chloroflexi bacterium]|nr:MAG: serine hydrolase [Chloroflexota bacterium]
MAPRRPYASRGVSRRATIRRSGGAASTAGVAALGVVFAVIAAAIIWIANPFSASNPSGRLVPAGSGQSAGDPSAPFASLQTASEESSAAIGATPMAATTSRHWEASADGIVPDATLASRLDHALLGVDGQIGVAVKDLGSGRGAVLNGDLELPAASLYKLPVLYAVFDAGLRMAEELPITDDALSYDAGTMELGAGEALSVAEALERMITISDNTSAVMLGGRVGPSRVNSSIAALGMSTTHYSLTRMTTSSLDILHLLDLLARGRAVSPAASADMLHLLLRQRVNDRLPRLLPDAIRVAHKTGNLPGTVNDVGIVYGPSATLAIAVLVSDTTDEAAAATGIARVAQAAFAYFDEQPAVADRPRIPAAPIRAVPPVWREPRPPTPTPIPSPSVEPTSAAPVVATSPTAATVVPAATLQPTAAVKAAPPTAVPTVGAQPARAAPTPPPAAPTAKPPAPTATPVPPPAPTTPPAQPTRLPTRPPAATPRPSR